MAARCCCHNGEAKICLHGLFQFCISVQLRLGRELHGPEMCSGMLKLRPERSANVE